MKKTKIVLWAILALATIIGLSGITSAAPKDQNYPEAAIADSDILPVPQLVSGVIFARYEGVDGESKDVDHLNWIDVLSVDWGAHQSDAGASGMSRRRGEAVVEDLAITVVYDKANPKLQEKCLKGGVIPNLEIEHTTSYGEGRVTYLKYELKNVLLSSFQISANAVEGPPTVVLINNFEEIKVTYTEYDDEGNSKGNVEYTWKVEKGES